MVSDRDVPAGRCALGMSFEKSGAQPFGAGGTVRLYINGDQAGEMALERTIPFMAGLADNLQCGADTGAPVTDDYRSPYAFTGRIHRVVVDISGHEPPRDLAQEALIEMARQ
jgi:arylsulfatase